jgi:phosphotriesterase-related protein
VPRLKRHGMDQRTINHILIENPRRVFSADHRAR